MRPISIAIVALAGVVLAGLMAGRFSDGPLEMIPGGPFVSAPEHGSASEFFTTDVETIELQIGSSPPRSTRTGILLRADAAYIPVTFAPLKLWPRVISNDPRVLVRINGHVVERLAVTVTDPQLLQELIALGRSKYGAPYHAKWAARVTRYFRLDPP
jgi:hypothetical protein